MLKRWFMIGLLMALLVGVGVAAAQDDDISPALEEQMASLEEITATLRNLPVKLPVERQFPTRQETIDYLRDLYAQELPPEEMERYKQFYVALDLLPADIDLTEVYLDLLGSQVAGFYDPDTRIMNVIPTLGDDPGNRLSFTEQIIYVHEFVHALQDQYFGLDALMESPDVMDQPDRSLAVTALVEGDATAIMTLYSQEVTMRNPLAALSMLVEGVQAGNLFLPEDIPPILTAELVLPYEEGMTFVIEVFRAGGWEAVDAAYADPPTTSEQILHPEKYVAGEGAQEVTLPDAGDALGDGWTRQWATTLGEFYLREHLDTQLSTPEAREAAAGWGGDTFQVYTNADDGIAWALRIAWDTLDDQVEFYEAYTQFGDARFGVSADANGCWQNADAALCLVPLGTPGSLIFSAPDMATVEALMGM